MIGVRKSGFKGDSVQKSVSFDGFQQKRKSGNWLYPAEMDGCEFRSGTLRRGVGLRCLVRKNGQDFTTTVGSGQGFYPVAFNDGSGVEDTKGYLIAGLDGYVYSLGENDIRATKQLYVGTQITYNTIKDQVQRIYHLFSGEEGVVYTVNGRDFYRTSEENVLSSAIAGHRYFMGVESCKVIYSAPHDPLNITPSVRGGGELYLPSKYGSVKKLQGVGDYLYVFMERGIFRVKVGANVEDIQVEEIEFGDGIICDNAALKLKEGVVFLADKGLYLVRGKEVKRICKQYSISAEETFYCKMGKCGELVLIDYKDRVTDSPKRIAVDVEEDEWFPIVSHGYLGENAYTLYGAGAYRYELNVKDGKGVYKRVPYFKTVDMDFGTQKRKQLKKIVLRGKGRIALEVYYGEYVHWQQLDFSDGVLELPLMERGRKFAFSFHLGFEAEIESVRVDYVCLE